MTNLCAAASLPLLGDYAHDVPHVPQADSGYGSGRRSFLTQAAAAALPTFLVPSLAAADSTGKFSSKVFARLRCAERCAAPLYVPGTGTRG